MTNGKRDQQQEAEHRGQPRSTERAPPGVSGGHAGRWPVLEFLPQASGEAVLGLPGRRPEIPVETIRWVAGLGLLLLDGLSQRITSRPTQAVRPRSRQAALGVHIPQSRLPGFRYTDPEPGPDTGSR